MTLSKERIYAGKRILESGIDFKGISKDKIMVTCQKYNGKITKENYEAVINAINNIYGKVRKCDCN
jgi:hypothetical protein